MQLQAKVAAILDPPAAKLSKRASKPSKTDLNGDSDWSPVSSFQRTHPVFHSLTTSSSSHASSSEPGPSRRASSRLLGKQPEIFPFDPSSVPGFEVHQSALDTAENEEEFFLAAVRLFAMAPQISSSYRPVYDYCNRRVSCHADHTSLRKSNP